MSRLCFFVNPWGSGEIRGRQIAEALGPEIATVNPQSLTDDDIFIGIKTFPPPQLVNRIRAAYIDVVDCHGTIPFIVENEKINAIAIGDTSYEHLCSLIPPERVVKIPEHHCNFERALKMPQFPIKTVGYIGEISGLHLVPAYIGDALRGLGIEFKMMFTYPNRQSVLNFYSDVDVQLTFRLDDRDGNVRPELKNPLKLNNAGACGIPTVSWPEKNYLDEWKGGFWEVQSLEDIVSVLKNMTLEEYNAMRYQAIGRAEHYHIDRILPLYTELLQR